jgi:hypothetical protein
MPEIAELVGRVNCGQCWARPGEPCDAPGGYHLARFVRARRRGLISEPDLRAVLQAAVVFTLATVISGDTSGVLSHASPANAQDCLTIVR